MADPYRQTPFAQRQVAEQDALAPWDAVEEPTWQQLAGPGYRGETAENFGESQAGQAEADPLAIEAQRRALANLQGQTGAGLTDSERQSFEQGLGEQRSALRGQSQANLQDLEARGQGGASAGTAALLGGAQAGANSAYQQQNAANAAAQQRALAAIQASGQLGGQMRQQSFAEQYGRGQAADYYRQRATQNAQGVMSRNMTRTNQYVDAKSAAYRDQADIRERTAAGRAGVHRTAAELAGAKADAERQKRDAWVGAGASIAKAGL